jgi:hypothetical protein
MASSKIPCPPVNWRKMLGVDVEKAAMMNRTNFGNFGHACNPIYFIQEKSFL